MILMEVIAISCKTSRAILGSTIGDGATNAPDYSSPGARPQDGVPHVEDMNTSPVRTIACSPRLGQVATTSPNGGGATGVKVCSIVRIQVRGIALLGEDTIPQEAATMSCHSRD